MWTSIYGGASSAPRKYSARSRPDRAAWPASAGSYWPELPENAILARARDGKANKDIMAKDLLSLPLISAPIDERALSTPDWHGFTAIGPVAESAAAAPEPDAPQGEYAAAADAPSALPGPADAAA